MIEILIVYLGILWLIFKKFKLLPVNTWTMVGAFLVGAFTMVFMLILLNMYQPITDDSRFVAATLRAAVTDLRRRLDVLEGRTATTGGAA